MERLFFFVIAVALAFGVGCLGRKQAEFLVYKTVPLNLITNIVVQNTNNQNRVQEILNQYNSPIRVSQNPNWFY
jgi:hypothetical protein